MHEDKNFIIQLEFDPNFTVENLISSIIDLLRLQNTMVYLTTIDNEILIPNLKIVDLIFLNPAKYKKLKVLSSNTNFQIPQVEYKDEKNFTSKRYDVVLQSTSDFSEDKNKLGYGLYKFNDEVNIKSNNNNMSGYISSNEKTLEPSSEINSNDLKYRSNPLGYTKEKDKELIQHKINYLKSKNNVNYEDEYLKERQPYDDYAYNNKSSIDLNKDNMSLNTGTNTNSNMNVPQISNNTNNYDYKNFYDKDPVHKNGATHLNTTIKKYDYSGSTEELDNKLNKKYTTKYMNYGENFNDLNRDNNKDVNMNVGVNDKSRSKMEREPSLNNINTYNENFEKSSSKKDLNIPSPNLNEDNNRIESIGTNQNSEYSSNKYNYSERLRDDLNRQRYSSEKRNFRNNLYVTANKNEEKSSELEDTLENKGKYEKYNENYADKMKYKYINDGWDSFKYEKDSLKSQKEHNNPANVNIMDIKSKINSIRSQVSSNMSFDRKVSEKNLESFSIKQGVERDNYGNLNPPESESRKASRSNIPIQSGTYKSKI